MGDIARSMCHAAGGFNGNSERRLHDRWHVVSNLPGVGQDRCGRGRQVMTQMTGSCRRRCARSAVLMTIAVRFSPLVLRRASPVAYQRADRRTGQRDG